MLFLGKNKSKDKVRTKWANIARVNFSACVKSLTDRK
jgi:hypothetical protein